MADALLHLRPKRRFHPEVMEGDPVELTSFQEHVEMLDRRRPGGAVVGDDPAMNDLETANPQSPELDVAEPDLYGLARRTSDQQSARTSVLGEESDIGVGTMLEGRQELEVDLWIDLWMPGSETIDEVAPLRPHPMTACDVTCERHLDRPGSGRSELRAQPCGERPGCSRGSFPAVRVRSVRRFLRSSCVICSRFAALARIRNHTT
jgi:hypothetical protein